MEGSIAEASFWNNDDRENVFAGFISKAYLEITTWRIIHMKSS